MAYTYLVSQGPTSTGPWTQVDNTTNTSDVISNLTPGQIYYFQVIPVDTASLIQGPPVVYGPISPTLNPTAPVLSPPTGITQTQVTLNWTASS